MSAHKCDANCAAAKQERARIAQIAEDAAAAIEARMAHPDGRVRAVTLRQFAELLRGVTGA